jgi:hypothetical protein
MVDLGISLGKRGRKARKLQLRIELLAMEAASDEAGEDKEEEGEESDM